MKSANIEQIEDMGSERVQKEIGLIYVNRKLVNEDSVCLIHYQTTQHLLSQKL